MGKSRNDLIFCQDENTCLIDQKKLFNVQGKLSTQLLKDLWITLLIRTPNTQNTLLCTGLRND